MFLMLIPQLAFKLLLCNQINLLCAAGEAFAINYLTTTTFLCFGGFSTFRGFSRMKLLRKSQGKAFIVSSLLSHRTDHLSFDVEGFMTERKQVY